MEAKIIEGNKLIAEFMGFRNYAGGGERVICNASLTPFAAYDFAHGNDLDKLKFHSSWDWLMPVLMEIGNRTGYTLVMNEDVSYWCNEGQHDELPEFRGYSNIENIWEAVIEFIKWHNK